MPYTTRDMNMYGTVKYTGSANDRDPILVNVGSTTPNNVRVQQLPERHREGVACGGA